MAGLPYMPLYVGDYLADTGHLTVTEHGAYLLLLMSLWRNETLAEDDRVLARHARCTAGQWARMKPTIMPFLEVEDGRVFHGRILHDLTATRAAVERQAQRSSNGGKATALKYKRTKAPTVPPQARQSKSNSIPEANASGEAPQKRRSRRCPADWMPSEKDIAALRAEGLGDFNTPRAVAKFKDHEFKDPRSDWSATYRNWIRDDAERAGRYTRPASGHDARKRGAMDYLAEQGDGQRQGLLAIADGSGRALPAGHAPGGHIRQSARKP